MAPSPGCALRPAFELVFVPEPLAVPPSPAEVFVLLGWLDGPVADGATNLFALAAPASAPPFASATAVCPVGTGVAVGASPCGTFHTQKP